MKTVKLKEVGIKRKKCKSGGAFVSYRGKI